MVNVQGKYRYTSHFRSAATVLLLSSGELVNVNYRIIFIIKPICQKFISKLLNGNEIFVLVVVYALLLLLQLEIDIDKSTATP